MKKKKKTRRGKKERKKPRGEIITAYEVFNEAKRGAIIGRARRIRVDSEGGQASRKLTAELLRADKWRAQKTGESIPACALRVIIFRNIVLHLLLLLLFQLLFFFFFFFSLLAAFPRIENRVSRHMSRNVIFICAFYYFSRPRFLKHIVPFKHNRERGRKSSFFRFPPSFPIFSLSLFFFL